ncbi:MAG: hypothetical protein AAB691_03155 [Patescibacteria group bacterium]
MALPSKVVDQLSRAPARTPGWSSRVLLFSATFFILSFGIYLGIQFGYKPYLENQIAGLEKEIADFSKQVPERDQDELISFYSQLDNLSTLLKKQSMPSKSFSWLEENTNVNVQLVSFVFNGTNKTMTLGGQARSIVNLGEQLNRFKSQSLVKSSQLTQLSLDQKSGVWTFSITLTMTPSFFASAMTSETIEASEPTTDLPIGTPASTTVPGVATSSTTSTSAQ